MIGRMAGVSLVQEVALVGAGVLAGLSGSMAGLASLFSYPALLAVGLTPVSANVSNTVSLGVGTLGAALGSGPELAGQSRNVRRYGIVAAAGGAAGAVLLLVTPAGVFEAVVPFLIAAASTVLLLQPRLASVTTTRPGGSTGPLALLGIFGIGIYGGYFGAAAGILMLALLGCLLPGSLLRINALKTVVLGLANVIAAVAFVAFGEVTWWAVFPLTAGLLVGNWSGPWLLRRLAPSGLRLCIALAGYGLATSYLYDALR
jgi:uncharacterized protein